MRIRILGPVDVDVDVDVDGDDAGGLGGPKERAVLAALALRSGSTVPEAVLIDAVWGDDPPRTATRTLQTYVARLRRTVPIGSAVGGYALACPVDLAEAEADATAARDAVRAGDPAAAAEHFGAALRWWTGPSLAEIPATPWIAGEAARLDELRATWADERADALLAAGRHAALVPELEALVAESPLRERRWALLMLALYRSGRQADALRAYQRVRGVLNEELGIEPGPELRELEARVLDQDPALDFAGGTAPAHATPAAARALGGTVPAPLSPLLGRDPELAALADLVRRPEVRIVTVAGTGGAGKTRLAVELAHHAAPAFADGAAFVSLEAVQDPALVLSAVTAALGTEVGPDGHGPALARQLAERELLLVVDNMEQVVEGGSGLADLAAAAPGVTIVVTSRRVLLVPGEHVFPLDPLRIDDAQRLFADLVAARSPATYAAEQVERDGRMICERLDCLPLAIELAAARTASLSPAALLAKLEQSFEILDARSRQVPPRQRTLRAALRWTTDQLGDDLLGVFARLSVFAGPFTLDAAVEVAGASLDDLADLVDWSLLRRDPFDLERFVMLTTIHAHAADILDGLGERAAAEAAHTEHYTRLAETTRMKGPGGDDGLARIDRDIANMRAVHARAEAAGDDTAALRLAAALWHYWYLRGLYREGLARVGGPLGRGAGDGALRSAGFHAMAGLSYLLSDFEASAAYAREGIAAGEPAEAWWPVSGCHTVLGLLAMGEDDFAAARTEIEASRDIALRCGFEEDVYVANNNLAEIGLSTGDYVAARAHYEHNTALRLASGQPTDLWSLQGLAEIDAYEGDLDAAEEKLARLLELAAASNYPAKVALALLWLGHIASARGQHADAAFLLGQADALIESIGSGFVTRDIDTREAIVARSGEALGAEAFAERYAAGRAAPSVHVPVNAS